MKSLYTQPFFFLILLIVLFACGGTEDETPMENTTDDTTEVTTEETTDETTTEETTDDPVLAAFDANFDILNDYPIPGEFSVSFSLDEGISWLSSIDDEDLSEVQSIWIRVDNSEIEVSTDYFQLDWSGSFVMPAEIDGNIAKFTNIQDELVGEEVVTAAVEIEVVFELVASGEEEISPNGIVYSVDLTSAETTRLTDDLFGQAEHMTYDPMSNTVYFSHDIYVGNPSDVISQFNPADGNSTPFNSSGDDFSTQIRISGIQCYEDSVVRKNLGYMEHVIYGISKDGGLRADERTTFFDSDQATLTYETTGGMAMGASANELLHGGIEYDALGLPTYLIIRSDIDGEIEGTIVLDYSNATNIPFGFNMITELTNGPSGEVYAVLEPSSPPTSPVSDDPLQYLISVDIADGSVTEIGVLSRYVPTGASTKLSGILYLPAYVFE